MTEVAVLGAGPAGLSAALGLMRRGLAAVVRDRARGPSERVCGAFLSAEALKHLDWLGVGGEAAAAGAPVRAVRIAAWFGLDRTLPLDPPGLALPRAALEKILCDKIAGGGGRVAWGDSSDGETPAVLAAGRFSRGAPAAGGPGWFGWNALFEGASQAPGELSLHFRPGGYAGVLTFADGKTNVCGLLYKEGPLAWEEAFAGETARMGSLRETLRRARRVSDWKGVGPLPYATDIGAADRFPVGDAAAVGDPFFGEGIGRALAAGPMLFTAWAAPDPAAAYRDAWRRAFAPRLRRGAALRFLLRRPALLHAALPLAARRGSLRFFSHLNAARI